MAVNRRLVGKVVQHLIQTHLLNAQHFDHSDYVQKCTDSYGRETHKADQESARKDVNAMKTSATLGDGTTVSPDAQNVCHAYDNQRIEKLSEKHNRQADAMGESDIPHERKLGRATQAALMTLRLALDSKVGASGYQVSDFYVNGDELDNRLKQKLGQQTSQASPAHQAHVQKVAQKQSQHGLQNPYTYLSQEFLRDCLIEDFQRTMSRREAATKATGVIRRIMRPLRAVSAKDKATKTMLAELPALNDAAVATTLHHIRPGQYDRHVRLAKLHEAALGILGSTHSQQLTPQYQQYAQAVKQAKKQGAAPPKPTPLTPVQAELDRAKVKIAYHLLKGLGDDVLMQIVNYKVKQKDRPAAQAQIDAAKDAHLATVQKLHDAYQAAASDPAQIKALAATLPDPPKPPKKKPKP